MQTTKKILYKEPKKQKQTSHLRTNLNSSHFLKGGLLKSIPICELDTSPLNYRKSFPRKELDELAADISQHGIISNLVVRRSESCRYELVAGERRFRAAKIAGLEEVPVNIVTLTDQEVIEIQLSENLQRSDTHPMEEAFAIERLQSVYKNIDEIVLRIGKSKAFVYKRLKLLSLIEPIQDLFMADKCTVQQAYEIATISSESQKDFFEEYCMDWKEDEDFEMPETSHALDRFRYDLTEAPFDTNDQELIPTMGACNSCPFNSAAVNSLFPEMAKEAICSNKECYNKKCLLNFSLKVKKFLTEDQPEALILQGNPERFENLLQVIPGVESFPKFNYYNIQTLDKPGIPNREDYLDEDGELGDDEGFKEALEEYENEMDEYEFQLVSANFKKGLLISERKITIVFFNSEIISKRHSFKSSPKAADVQSAIKSGTATIELLQGEIDRIHLKEERSIELDREKVQAEVQSQFMNQLDKLCSKPTEADLVAVRLILFQSLDFSTRNTVLQSLFIENEKFDYRDNEQLYRQLENLSEDQFAYLIRMAVASKSDSKNPKSETAYFLYKMAEQAGLQLEEIENKQKVKSDKRQINQLEKISRLKKQIGETKA
jgi:ParB family chromosome partitioning protein